MHHISLSKDENISMNLTVDIGNYLTKVAIFDDLQQIVHNAVFHWLDTNTAAALLNTYHIDAAIVSSVQKSGRMLLDYLREHCATVVRMSCSTPLPMVVHYSRQTLGCDRLAAAMGAGAILPNSNVLVVDSGTCITYDLLTATGEYMGGNIAPGLQMRLDAMRHYTKRLPHVDTEKPLVLLGTDTQEALHGGAYWGIVNEIEGYYKMLQQQYTPLTVALTGGNSKILSSNLLCPHKIEPNLVHIGLNRILQYSL